MNEEIVCFNLVDFKVSWHRMSLNCENNEENCFNDLDDENDDDTFVIKQSEEKFAFQTLLDEIIGLNKTETSKSGDYSEKSQPNEQIIGQINLYNKYNAARINDFKYEINDENNLKFEGFLKIHWNLNKPIQLVSESVIPINFNSIDNNESNFDTHKSTTHDDSIIEDTKNKTKTIGLSRATSVYYKGREIKRPSRHINKTNQYFIPSYNSVSAVHIDNHTTCQEAIKILFEKYHILNSPEDYSFYKILQTGEKSELNSIEMPLEHRLRMGPFIEDKIFIMEKGVEININIEVENLIRLPLHLLNGLLDNLNIQENKDLEILLNRFNYYRENLIKRLNSFQTSV